VPNIYHSSRKHIYKCSITIGLVFWSHFQEAPQLCQHNRWEKMTKCLCILFSCDWTFKKLRIRTLEIFVTRPSSRVVVSTYLYVFGMQTRASEVLGCLSTERSCLFFCFYSYVFRSSSVFYSNHWTQQRYLTQECIERSSETGISLKNHCLCSVKYSYVFVLIVMVLITFRRRCPRHDLIANGTTFK
jgi:hypothetical protein